VAEVFPAAVGCYADPGLADLGGQVGLAPGLQSLAARHPLREDLHGQLMLARYRCGRQAEHWSPTCAFATS
jgi:hypothetical protein